MEWLQTLPGWVGAVGWAVVLVGHLFQRKARQVRLTQSNKAFNFGASNSVTQTIQGRVETGPGATPSDSPASSLETWANWATIAGLAVSLLPLLKDLTGK